MINSESPDNPSKPHQQEKDIQSSIIVEFTPEYWRNLRDLAKRYRNIRSDLQEVIEELERGNFVGDRIPGVGIEDQIFKVRIRNRDIRKGKSAGYRLIYWVESPTSVLLLTIYSKSDREDIPAGEIRQIVNEFYESE